jgi:hypothetical protein
VPALAALAAAATLAALAVFQLALAAGAPLGHLAWGGQHRTLPRNLRIGSLVSVAIYAAIGLVLLDRAGLLALLPPGWSAVAAWVLVAYFALGVGMNAISRSWPERLVMTPVAALLCVLSLVVALG